MRALTELPRFEPLRSKDSLRVDAAQLQNDAMIAAVLPECSSVYVRGNGLCVLAVARGSVECVAQEGEFVLDRGEWLILPVNSAPRIRADANALASVIILGEGVSVCDRLGLPLPHGRGRLQLSTLRLIVTGLRACADSSAVQEGAEARGILLDAIAEMTPPQALIGRCPGRTVRRKREIYGRLLRARLHIEGHPHQIPRVAELASLCRFSSWYFTKAFTDVFGASPQSFGRSYRLQYARRILLGSSLSVSEVAAACGFDNPSAFARAFHQYFGATASDLRRARAGGAWPGRHIQLNR